MTARLWRFVEWRLRRSVPAHRIAAVLTDLSEDFAVREQREGTLRATWWLLRESRSLAVAYRTRELQTWLASIGHDTRFAARNVRRRPLRFLAAAGMLGLAIGLTTSMFTIVDALVLRPVPFSKADQLATVVMGGSRGGPSPTQAVFEAWRRSDVLADVEGARSDVGSIETDTGEMRRRIARVTPGVFALLGGVRPIAGRLFDANDGRAGSEDRVIVSEDLWRAAFNGDPSLIGRTIRLSQRPAVVVGVLPSTFHFPYWEDAVWKADAFDLPAAFGPPVYVRFADSVPRADALRRATDIARDADPKGTMGRWAQARSLSEQQIDTQYKEAAPILGMGVVLLFVVLCANVSSLQLAGMTARAREFATRAALGASRGRLVRQALIESALAGAAGIASGTGLAWMLLELAGVWLFDALALHSLNAATIDRRALVVTSVAGLVATLAASLLPALLGTRVQQPSLQLTDRSGTETSRARAGARALLVCQIALSCALLIGATLLARSFVTLVNADRGFDIRDILVARVQMPPTTTVDQPWRDRAGQTLQDEARAIPGVTMATWSYGTPPAGASTVEGTWLSDAPGAQPLRRDAYQFIVGPDFFALYGIPIIRGRAIEPTDPRTTVLIGERFARLLWPGLDPIGRTFTQGRNQPSATVVGVVKDIRFPSLDPTRDAPQFYRQFAGLLTQGTLSLKCASACPAEELVRQRLAKAMPGADVYSVKTLESSYAREFARPRAAAGLAIAFAVTALIAAATGLFSLLSHVVARRRREFAIRTALGASAAQVSRIVVRDGLVVALAGITLGACAGAAIARAMRSFLFGVGATDPATWITVIGLLVLTIAAACWQPTRAAIRTNPVVLLRDE